MNCYLPAIIEVEMAETVAVSAALQLLTTCSGTTFLPPTPVVVQFTAGVSDTLQYVVRLVPAVIFEVAMARVAHPR